MAAANRLTLSIWMLFHGVLVILCALIIVLLPLVSALENEENAILSLTSVGRFYLASRSFLGILALSLIPTGISYMLTKGLGIFDEKPARFGRGARMALFVWLALVVCGLIGALGFWLQIHPFQLR